MEVVKKVEDTKGKKIKFYVLRGFIQEDPIFHEFTNKKGVLGRVVNYYLIKQFPDGTTKRTTCSAYDKFANEASGFRAGDKVKVYGFYKTKWKSDKKFNDFIVRHQELLEPVKSNAFLEEQEKQI